MTIDYLTYQSFVWMDLLEVDAAKALGFLGGTIFAYFANRIWTFSHQKTISGSMWRFIILYSATLGINVVANAMMLGMLADFIGVVQIAFVFATGLSACLNFWGMKLFVFKENVIVERV